MQGKVVDLFCGCGGFSLGSALAGFRSVASVDIDQTLQSGYRRNFPTTKAIQADISSLDRTDWSILLENSTIDGVIGGPPCQGFSRIGKRLSDDPRNSLIYHFYRTVSLLNPRFFIMENVEGLLDEKSIHLLESGLSLVASKYTILAPIILTASDFGAATFRRRVIIVGYKSEHVDYIDRSEIERKYDTRVTVRDAIFDLPRPQPVIEKDDYSWGAYSHGFHNASEYAQRLRRPPPDGLGWNDAIHRLASGEVSGVQTTRHASEIIQRYQNVTPGKSDPITKSYRLSWDGQCPTLRAGTGSDRGAFQAVRPLHPTQGRVITVREGARLQGFPDWFVFHPTKWHSFRMLGNSVPPPVSHHLMRIMADKIGVALAA